MSYISMNNKTEDYERFNWIPNIGKELAKKLNIAGIKNYQELRAIGSQNAFITLKTIDENACINELYALEGAIRE